MKVIITILCLICQLLVIGQKNDTIKKYLDGNFLLTTRNKMVYPALAYKSGDSWLVIANYADKNPVYKAFFEDRQLTRKDGPYTLYYPLNKLAVEGQYKEGRRSGVWKYYYENGQLKDSGQMMSHQLVGTWKTWYDNGFPLLTVDYLFPTSGSEFSDRSRNLSSKSNTENPTEFIKIKNGKFLRYYSSGLPSDSGQYSQNRKTGLWKIWFSNGQLEASGYFSNDSLQGEWSWYRENGILATKEIYRNNRLVALQCFDESGNYSGEHCSILKPPVPVGDYTDFENYLLDNIILPKDLIGVQLEGTVTITCTISRDGKL